MNGLCDMPVELFGMISEYLDGLDIANLWYAGKVLQHLMGPFGGIKMFKIEHVGRVGLGFPKVLKHFVGLRTLVVHHPNANIDSSYNIWNTIKDLVELRSIDFDFPEAFVWLVEDRKIETEDFIDSHDLSLHFPHLQELNLQMHSNAVVWSFPRFTIPQTVRKLKILPFSSMKFPNQFFVNLPSQLDSLYMNSLPVASFSALPRSLTYLHCHVLYEKSYDRTKNGSPLKSMHLLPPGLTRFDIPRFDCTHWLENHMKVSSFTDLRLQFYPGFNINKHIGLLPPTTLTTLQLPSSDFDECQLPLLPRGLLELKVNSIRMNESFVDEALKYHIAGQFFDTNHLSVGLKHCWPPGLTSLFLFDVWHDWKVCIHGSPKSLTKLSFQLFDDDNWHGSDLPRQLQYIAMSGHLDKPPLHYSWLFDLPPSLTELKVYFDTSNIDWLSTISNQETR